MVAVDASIYNKSFADQALWLIKFVEDDLTLRDYDSNPALFQHMFPDSSISEGFTVCRQKPSYVIQDGLCPLVSKYTWSEVSSSPSGFTLFFDETTTLQSRKQVDLLIHFWSQKSNQVVTRYLSSISFGRAPALDLV